MRLTRMIGATALAVAAGTAGLTVQATPASAAPVIVCKLTVDHPHHSSTVRGTVNVHARTLCTGRTAAISMVVSLFRDGSLVGTSGVVTGPGASLVNANAAAPCVTGTYQGRAGSIIAYPPGGVPSEETLLVNSPSVTLICA